MKTEYSKSSTLPRELIPLLRERGLSVADEQTAISYLTNIGYYRLSAYLYPLLEDPKEAHHYKTGASFDLAINMYRFDRHLRMLLFNKIEKIEVAIRSAMTNMISHDLDDVFWMTELKYFNNPLIFSKRLVLIDTEIDKSNEEFIVHYRDKYSNPYPPAWMIAEIIPFGVLCSTFNNLKIKSVQKRVANHFGLPLPVFSSWIVSLVSLRNLCGHHNRTWNREVPLIPAPLKSPAFSWIDNTTAIDMKRIYYRLCIIRYFLFTVSPQSRFAQRLKSLLEEYHTIDIKPMGFPDKDWMHEPLWKQ